MNCCWEGPKILQLNWMLVNSESVKMGYRQPGVIYRSISDGRVKIQTKLRWMIKRDVLHVYYCSLNLTRLLTVESVCYLR